MVKGFCNKETSLHYFYMQVEVAHLKNESIPLGWLMDENGKLTSDPSGITGDAILMPLGRTEEHSGYKGTGLGMMVEVLCGILSGKCEGC